MPVPQGALCRRAISVDARITVASPGRVDVGITKSVTVATGGGGMSGELGISTRNHWRGHPPMCPRLKS
jgi:hypothetical protein